MGAATTAIIAHHHQVVNAVKAVGALVTVEVPEFIEILSRSDHPLVVWAEGGFFKKHYRYITPYRGMAFYCQKDTPLQLPEGAEVVAAQKIAMPDL